MLNAKNPDHLFVAGSSTSGANSVMALYKSLDGGDTWTTYRITSTGGVAKAVTIDPDNDNTIYVGGLKGTSGALFKSTDGGSSWVEIGKGVFDSVSNIVLDPVSKNKIYVGSQSGLYKSENSGVFWKKTAEFSVKCMKMDPFSPNKIYAAGESGVYLSKDWGKTWSDYNAGLSVKNVNCLDITPSGKTLYTGTQGGGIYKIR